MTFKSHDMHIFSLDVLPAIICDMICDLAQEGHSLYQMLAIFVITRSSRGFIPCQYHVDFIQIHDVHGMEFCHSVNYELQGYLSGSIEIIHISNSMNLTYWSPIVY